MHKLTSIYQNSESSPEVVILVEQNPASIILLTAADTDIQTVAASYHLLPEDFPSLRVVNLLQLRQQLSIDTYADTVLSKAQVIILRLLGGRSYWSYGLEVVKETVESSGGKLFVLPGDDQPDAELISHSNVSLAAVNCLWQYFNQGGINNLANALQYVSDVSFESSYQPLGPQTVPKIGIYEGYKTNLSPHHPRIAILFYRAHYLAGNLLPIDALCQALQEKKLQPVPIFLASLRDVEVQRSLGDYLSGSKLILNTTSFSLHKIGEKEEQNFWQALNLPVLQVILSSSTIEQWENSLQGLNPTDMGMNVALPEVDGRIITRAISFKEVQKWQNQLETEIVIYQPHRDRVAWVADLASNWVKLRQTPAKEKRIALILANYPNRNGRIANGVGLDTPASCLAILQALQQAGYQVENIPATVKELMENLMAGVTNDAESYATGKVRQSLSLEEYQAYFATLPEKIQREISTRWGDLPSQAIPIPGIQLGNIFLGIQPARGYDLDPSLNYHAPDLEPTPAYLAFYYWLREVFKAQAVIHLGKHGNLEWLPGKSIALDATCYPEVTLGSLPHFYPFIVNDPGEGSQAKRRSQAVILDHLTPPLTRAELYGSLQQLELLIDEYDQAQSLDPGRLPLIRAKIEELVRKSNLKDDLGLKGENLPSLDYFLTAASGYLCELKEAQIRDGLHIFGNCPQGRQLRDLAVAIARFPSGGRKGLTQAMVLDRGLDIDPLLPSPLVAELEAEAATLVERVIESKSYLEVPGLNTQAVLNWIQIELLPNLKETKREINHLLQGLEGKYVPPGPSGAPTRGRPEVLPTGRNFYSVDIRAIPTQTAWDVGRKAAEVVIERYTQENGEYPRSLAISVWGTSTMRTGGDDVAEVLALLGVRPIWEMSNGRVVDFEILTPTALGRPRVDVTMRVSGFFRDSFPNLLQLVYQAIAAVSSLPEPPEINPLAAQVAQDETWWQTQGLNTSQAAERSRYRIFGSKPGAYGAGLQGLIEAQNWTDEQDLARAYLNWSCYAYTYEQGVKAQAAPEAFAARLRELQIVLQNQDNREHDLLDSDDYYQFQGGLTAAVRAATGKNPQIYFGDNSLPHHPRVRHLQEEITRVYRSRVVNPKWIAGVMRHGYKGAFEMAATVDYLFAYDATTECIPDYIYAGVTEAYVLQADVKEFLTMHNPWALRDLAERLLEAQQRGLWHNPSPEMRDRLRHIVHEAEAIIETQANII